jgi:antitoxin (DNA-binding transcriptional repressor) of toxin-antitoxin stability system
MPLLEAGRNMAIYMAVFQGRPHVTAYSVAEAKNTLPKLIDRALQGEEVVITRHGKPVAELRAVPRPPAPPRGTYEWLRSRRDARPGVGLTSVEILDLLYETDEH